MPSLGLYLIIAGAQKIPLYNIKYSAFGIGNILFLAGTLTLERNHQLNSPHNMGTGDQKEPKHIGGLMPG